MPIWLQPVIGFLGQRFTHFAVYALIGLITIGIPYKLFFKAKPTEQHIQNYQACEKETPIVGCALWKLQVKAVIK